MVIIQISPALVGMPTLPQAVPGSNVLPLFSLPDTLWPWVLTHPDFSKLPSSKLLLQLEGFPRDLPGVFLPRLLGLGGHAGHCKLLAESIAPFWNKAPDQSQAASTELARGFPFSLLVHCF